MPENPSTADAQRRETRQEHFERTHHTVQDNIDWPGWRCRDCPAESIAWKLKHRGEVGPVVPVPGLDNPKTS